MKSRVTAGCQGNSQRREGMDPGRRLPRVVGLGRSLAQLTERRRRGRLWPMGGVGLEAAAEKLGAQVRGAVVVGTVLKGSEKAQCRSSRSGAGWGNPVALGCVALLRASRGGLSVLFPPPPAAAPVVTGL